MSNVHMPTKRVLDILTTLSTYENGLNLTEISELTQIAKSTLQPILRTMVDNDFLKKNDSNYKISANLFKIGQSFLNSTNVLTIIKKNMTDIMRECNEICQLGILQGKNVLYIEKLEPTRSIKLVSSVGKSLPAYATALGKALISYYSEDKLISLYGMKFEKFTDNTIDNIEDLLSELSKIRNLGLSLEKGEYTKDVHCVAIPLTSKNKIFASVSISIPAFRSSEKKLNDVSSVLLKYKSKIEKEITGLPIDF